MVLSIFLFTTSIGAAAASSSNHYYYRTGKLALRRTAALHRHSSRTFGARSPTRSIQSTQSAFVVGSSKDFYRPAVPTTSVTSSNYCTNLISHFSNITDGTKQQRSLLTKIMAGEDIDGKAIAKTIRKEVLDAVLELKEVRNKIFLSMGRMSVFWGIPLLFSYVCI